MNISELTQAQVDDINDKFEDYQYELLKARKIRTDICKKYGIGNYNQLYRVIRNPVCLMRRHAKEG